MQMTKPVDADMLLHLRHYNLETFIANEVKYVLLEYYELIGRQKTTSPNGTAANGAVGAPPQTWPISIGDELAGIASKFVHRVAVETARSLNEEIHVAAKMHPKRLEEWAGEVCGPTYLEKHFGVPRSTLYWWQQHNDVVALPKGTRKHVFPLAQFIDGRPAPGLRDVLSFFPTHRIGWAWLVQPSQFLDGRVPIELLRQDKIACVVQAARADSKKS